MSTIIDWERIAKEVIAENEQLKLQLQNVSYCKRPNIHQCLNDLSEVVDRRLQTQSIDKGSLRYEFKKAIDKMICCGR